MVSLPSPVAKNFSSCSSVGTEKLSILFPFFFGGSSLEARKESHSCLESHQEYSHFISTSCFVTKSWPKRKDSPSGITAILISCPTRFSPKKRGAIKKSTTGIFSPVTENKSTCSERGTGLNFSCQKGPSNRSRTLKLMSEYSHPVSNTASVASGESLVRVAQM